MPKFIVNQCQKRKKEYSLFYSKDEVWNKKYNINKFNYYPEQRV